MTGIPAEIADGDNDTTYSAGVGMALSGTTFNAEGSPYAQVIVVAKSGGDYTSIQAALDSISDADASKPYLVYVAPGVYAERVTMKAYVTIEGAGQGATIIRWVGGDPGPSSATIIGASSAALRNLSLESNGSGNMYGVGIYNSSTASTINNVTITTSGGTYNLGIQNISCNPTLNNVIITVSGGTSSVGISNASSNPTISNATIMVSGGTFNHGIYNHNSSNPTIRDSAISGSTNSIYSSGGTTTKVAYSMLNGPRSAGTTCIGTYDANFAPVTCP